ncbi:MAG: J domain-containing protein [Ignavibacteria bacterium]|nr:J domain-containing protein [Ignavibacteria bacterium]
MGQLFERIKNFFKIHIGGNESIGGPNEFNVDFDFDSELKRQIDDAVSDAKNCHTNTSKEDFYTEKDPYKILGIEKNSSPDEIKEAYRKKVREYHPDRVAQLGTELRELANKKMKEINWAYETLRKIRGL